jgi:preprotein translocase subunit SecF
MLPNLYQGDYRRLAAIPLLMVVLSIYFIPMIKMGVDFQGGTVVTLSLKGPAVAEDLQTELRGEGLEATVRVFQTAVGYRAEIEVPQSEDLVKADGLKSEFNALLPDVAFLEVASLQNGSKEAAYLEKKAGLDAIADQMLSLALMSRSGMNISSTNDLQTAFSTAYSAVYSNYQQSIARPLEKHVEYDSISVQTVSPGLSSHFIEVAINVVLLAIVLSLVMVFLFFRDLVPSLAVLTGAVCDIIIALGAMGLFGIPLTLASFAALLMLLGFSLDTDILLTTRMLKRKGDPRETANDAMKTGLTMSVMAIIAFGALFIIAVVTRIPTYYEISAVALAGLVADMFATWGINGVMMLHHVESRRRA